MAFYNNLTGAGVQNLSAGTTALAGQILTYPPGRSVGRANPANYYGIGLLRLGNGGYWEKDFPIDAGNFYVSIPSDVNEVAWSLFNGASISLTEVFATTTPSNWQMQPWDRNPLPILRSFWAGINGGTAQTTAWTYTVPANRKFIVGSAEARALRTAASSSGLNSTCAIRINGSAFIYGIVASNTVGADDIGRISGGLVVCRAADVIDAVYANADTGGTVGYSLFMSGTEFDA